MKKKNVILSVLVFISILLISTVSNGAVDVKRNVYSNNGSMKFDFSGLELDDTHEYEYGLTKTTTEEVKTWHTITEYTETTAVIDVITTSSDLRNVINLVDKGYITIRDKTSESKDIVLESYAVDLKIPFLGVTNYTVIPNGKEFSTGSSSGIQIALRNAYNSTAYYQYEKITDESIINKYKEIKLRNGDFAEMQNMLTSTVPTSKWSTWQYWNEFSASGMGGYGYPQSHISAPDTGLYYLWVYFSGKDLKNIYGYILVDNLQPEISLESISIPKTATVELGGTLTLTPTFNPSNATNKIVTWTSSDETVASIDNAGKVTPKKVGSTIITVTSQDGKKQATCTVTVTETSNNTNGENSSQNTGNNNSNKENENNGSSVAQTPSAGTSSTQKVAGDGTTAKTKLPNTGKGIILVMAMMLIIITGGISKIKYNTYKDIK